MAIELCVKSTMSLQTQMFEKKPTMNKKIIFYFRRIKTFMQHLFLFF